MFKLFSSSYTSEWPEQGQNWLELELNWFEPVIWLGCVLVIMDCQINLNLYIQLNCKFELTLWCILMFWLIDLYYLLLLLFFPMAKNKPNSSPNLLDFEQSPPNISTRSHVTGKPITHLHPSLTQPFLNILNVFRFPVSPVFQVYIYI